MISEKPTPDEINAEIKRRIGNNLKDFLSDYRDYAKELGLTDESVLLLAILRESKITNDILQQLTIELQRLTLALTKREATP